MGLAASQSKLLSLTTRLSRLEYQAQKLSNDKIRMAMESDAISAKYLKALSQKKLTVENGDGNYVTATANKLIDYNALGDAGTGTQRILKDNTGRVIVSNETAQAFKAAKTASASLANQYGSLSQYLQTLIDNKTISTTPQTSRVTENVPVYDTEKVYDTYDEQKTPPTVDGLYTPSNQGGSKVNGEARLESYFAEDGIVDNYVSEVYCGDKSSVTAAKIAEAIALDEVRCSSKGVNIDDNYRSEYLFNLCDFDIKTFDLSTNIACNGLSNCSLYNQTILNEATNSSSENHEESAEYMRKVIKYFELGGSRNDSVETMKKLLKITDTDLNDKQSIINSIELTESEKASATTFLPFLIEDIDQGSNSGMQSFLELKVFEAAYTKAVEEGYQSSTYTTKNTNTIINYTQVNKEITIEVPDETEIAKYTASYNNSINGNETFLNQLGYTTDSSYSGTDLKYDATAVSWYEEIFQEMEDCGYATVSDEQLNDADWLYNNLNMGAVYITEKTKDTDGDGKKDWNEIAWATGDNAIQVEDDDSTQAVAKAEYDREINNNKEKEQKIDVQLKNIDTEHSSIKNEADSTQKIIDKNIERNGKIFEA